MYPIQNNPYYFGKYLSDNDRLKARSEASRFK